MLCERCGKEVYKYNKCEYCSKKICSNCLKSSKKTTRTDPLFICKDCWSNMAKRSKYKSALGDK